MNQKIEENASSISLYDLWMMIRRNIYSIIYFTVLGLVLGLVYTNLIVTPEFTATGYVAMKVSTTTTVLNTITEVAKSRSVADLAVTALDEDGIAHSDGTPITAADITAGVNATYTSTSLRVTVTYTNDEQLITVPVLNAVIDATISYGNTNYTAINNNLILESYAETSINSGTSTTLYLAIFVILGGVIGTGLGIFTDIIEDRIHYAGEIARAGVNAFTVSCHEKKKPAAKKKDPSELLVDELDLVDTAQKDDVYYRDVLKLQNDIENFTPGKQVKTIGFTSAKEYQSKASLLASLAHVYAKEQQKVLVLDFDFEKPFLHQVFEVGTVKNLVAYYLSYKPKEEFFERVNPYLYVMPGLESAIGSKIIKSERIKKLIEEARKEFDYVLINCPPTFSEMTILSCGALLDGVIIAGKFQVTKKKDFLKTASLVLVNDMHLIGGAFLGAAKEKRSLKKVFLSLFSKSSH